MMSKTMSTCVSTLEDRDEIESSLDAEKREIAERHRQEEREHELRREELMSSYASASNEILRRVKNTAEVVKNVAYKKFAPIDAIAFLRANNLEWVGDPQLRSEDSYEKLTVVSLSEGTDYTTLKVRTADGTVKTWWIPKGFLTSSTWHVAKETRRRAYILKVSVKQSKVKEIEEELNRAKKEYEARLKAVSALTEKLEKANSKLKKETSISV